MDFIVKYNSNEELASKFNEVNALINHYQRETLKMMRKQIWLDMKIVESNEFRNAVVEWVKSSPEEAMALYIISDKLSYEVTVMTFGEVLEEGNYCDFCENHSNVIFNSIIGDIERYSIYDRNTGYKSNTNLKDIVARYDEMAMKNQTKSLEVRMGHQVIMYPVIKSEVKMSSENKVSYGKMYAKSSLIKVIQEIMNDEFIIESFNKAKIKGVEDNSDNTYRDNVVSISKIKNIG